MNTEDRNCTSTTPYNKGKTHSAANIQPVRRGTATANSNAAASADPTASLSGNHSQTPSICSETTP